MKNFKISLVIVTALVLVLAGSIFDTGYTMNKETALRSIEDSSITVRRHAAYSLGELGDPAGVEALVMGLSDQDAHVRRISAHALGKIQDAQAVKPLTALLKDRNQPTCVRCSAAFALGRIGNHTAINVLAQTVRDEQGWLKSVAVTSLAKLQPAATLAMNN